MTVTGTYMSDKTSGSGGVGVVNNMGGNGGVGLYHGSVIFQLADGVRISADELYDLKCMIDFFIETDPHFKELYTAWRAKNRLLTGEKK